MHATVDYHSVSDADTERTPYLENQTAAREPHSDDESDNSHDLEGGLNPSVDGNNDVPAKPDGGEHANDFPLGPGSISQESWAIKLLSWTWEVVLTALPLFFIGIVFLGKLASASGLTPYKAISVLAVKLDKQARSSSKYGGKVEEITRLGPTIYPILFAMVAARFYKNIARWHLERPGGITISALEQIFGSQSFASALERLIVIRVRPLLGALILLSWVMSPLGGQSSSRLLRVENFVSFDWVYYNNIAYQSSVYLDMDFWRYEGMVDFVTAVYSASVLSPKKQQQAFMDLWGRPKVPQWPWTPAQGGEEMADSCREVDGDALEAGNDYYTSLRGVSMKALSFSDNSTQYQFNLESDYISLNCSMIASEASRDDLERITYPTKDYSARPIQGNLDKAFRGYSEAWKEPLPSFNAALGEPSSVFDDPYLLYTTRGGHEYYGYKYTVFNCTITAINLRTSLICTIQGCRPQRQCRLPALQLDGSDLNRRRTEFRNAIEKWPEMTDIAGGKTSATDSYVANNQPAHRIDTRIFSRRLTAAFNTIWVAGSESKNFTTSSLTSPEDPVASWSNHTQATITSSEQAYYTNKIWVATLVLTTTFLQVLAICGLALKCLIRGPDILGFASSLTRDNAFVPVSGGSFQGGAERARSLKNMRVQLADVQPRDHRGYIALSTVPRAVPGADNIDGDEEESPSLGHLERKRLYV